MTNRNPKRMAGRELARTRKAQRGLKYRPSDLSAFGLVTD